jgi:hypothetical protein
MEGLQQGTICMVGVEKSLLRQLEERYLVWVSAYVTSLEIQETGPHKA